MEGSYIPGVAIKLIAHVTVDFVHVAVKKLFNYAYRRKTN